MAEDKNTLIENKLYTSQNGLPSTFNNFVFRVKQNIVVATTKGIYEFDEVKHKFIKSEKYESIFGSTAISYLKEDNEGNIWFFSDKKLGVVNFNTNIKRGFKLIYFPELETKILRDFVNIYPFDKNNIFIGANKGIIHIDLEKYNKTSYPINIHLTKVKTLVKNETLFGGYTRNPTLRMKDVNSSGVSLRNKNNALQFSYASTSFEQIETIKYSFRLIGFDLNWSDWTEKKEKDYTNLPAGNYTFAVKAKNNLGEESESINYSFKIEPAWYQTTLMYILYILAVLSLFYFLVKYQKNKHFKQQLKLKREHEIELDLNQKKILELENEKLITAVNFKNKELTTMSFNLMQRGKLMVSIKGQIIPILTAVEPVNSEEKLKKILKLLNDAEKSENEWEHFAVNFDKIHASFLANLKEKVPTLSINELKLCAYLKINLSSKEIAQLMNVSVRAVEMSRYRLRKKLNLDTDTNLFNYLIKITST